MTSFDTAVQPASTTPQVADLGKCLVGLRSRLLCKDEIAFAKSHPGLPLVLEPEDQTTADEWVRMVGHCARPIRTALHRHGAVLLRPRLPQAPHTFSASHFRAVTDLLGFRDGGYPYFTDNYRAPLAPGVVNASSTPSAFPVPPHTEQAFNRIRPGVVAFVCLQPPRAGGETPLHDCVAAYASLPSDIQALLDRSWFRKETRGMSDSAVQANFNTPDRDIIAQICSDFGVAHTWRDGRLSIVAEGPCSVIHPITGQRAFSCFWTAYSIHHFFRTFGGSAIAADRTASSLARWLPAGLAATLLRRLHPMFRRDYVYSFRTSGKPAMFPAAVEEALNRAMWSCCTVFRWERGDVLLIDNIKTAHSRMPFEPPRSIGAAVFDRYDSAAIAHSLDAGS